MAYAVAWNEATPVGASVDAATIDTELQDLKKSVRERMNDILSNAWETDASEPKTLDVRAIAGTFRGARVRVSSGTFSLPSGATTAIEFDAEDIDTDTFHAAGALTRLTVATAGYYYLNTNIGVNTLATAGLATLTIRKNGSTNLAEFRLSHPGGTVTRHISVALMTLAAATDYYEVLVAQASGDAWAAENDDGNSFFEIFWLPSAA